MSPFYGVHAAEGIKLLDHALFRRNPEVAEGARIRHLDRVAMGFEPVSLPSGLDSALQPLVDGRGSMVVFDGRIDNADELCPLLGLEPSEGAEAEIVRAAFAAWGEGCFSRLLGDWALAFWCGSRRTLYLARDHAGTRCVYFARSGSQILWSSRLSDLQACPAPREPDEAFAACYLAGLPLRNLTPFAGVRSVPPGHFLAYDGKTLALREHWSPRARDLIVYRTDSAYKEHFLDLFERSVMRRTRTGSPILAELSGGMDSSSIVCVDDRWRRRDGATAAELLDTVSYFDEEEPSWDERRYFVCVERARGKEGVHLPLPLLSADLEPPPVFYDRPGGDLAAFENEKRLQEAVGDRGYRVLLSGIGGDELLGGVPTPYPELADLWARGRVGTLTRQSVAWALCLRKPIVGLAAETATWTIGQYLQRPSLRDLPPWATDKLGARAREADTTPPVSMRIAGLGPRSIHRQRTWWAILETLPHLRSRALMALEYRYPYLDRDLVEFLLRVPPGQLVRPGQRRSLMRRALQGITPREILDRPRKGFRFHGLVVPLRRSVARLQALIAQSETAEMGLIEPRRLEEWLPRILGSEDPRWVHPLTRFVLYELWRRSFALSKGGDIPET
jgi:asparagine synthase (glutamine-hydrolysing)